MSSSLPSPAVCVCVYASNVCKTRDGEKGEREKEGERDKMMARDRGGERDKEIGRAHV